MPETAEADIRFGSGGDARAVIAGVVDEEVAVAFPGWPMVSPAYPTADHVMPFKLFALLAAELPRRWAAEQLRQANAIATGIRQALDGRSGDARAEWDRLLEQGFPAPKGLTPVPPALFPKKD
jgi:hypothetical protein